MAGETATPVVPASMAHRAEHWERVVRAVLRHAADMPQQLAAALAAAPHAPALIALNGIALLLLGRAEASREAATLLEPARAALRAHGDAADRALVDALAAWLGGRPSRAAAILDAALAAHPGDALALKLVQSIRFMHGDEQGMQASARAAIDGFAAGHPHRGYALGCLAFALEEGAQYAAAERVGRAALELAPDDAWGLHAVAHVCEMTGRPRDGKALVAARPDAYAHCSTFRHHVLWHAALFELELGATDSALALYDGEIRRARTDDYRDIANAASLLARLGGEGVDVGDRWEELADVAERRAGDAQCAFADLHYLLALLGARRDAAAARLARRMGSASVASEAGRVTVEVGAAAAAGLAAFAAAQHDDALAALLPARARLSELGGSNAQRDVFERIAIDCALAAGRAAVARRLLLERTTRRGADRFARSRLARCGAAVPSVSAAA